MAPATDFARVALRRFSPSSSAILPRPYTCPRCTPITTATSILPARRRHLSTTPPLFSGHSKWATIKHDKAKNDKVKARARTLVASQIAFASRLGGVEPKTNVKLATAIAVGKRAGLSKATIEAAVLRGQGRSVSGAALEALTIEAMLPGNVAVVIECATDSKKRTMQDIRSILKGKGGTNSSVLFLFDKRGEVVFGTTVEGEAADAAEQLLDPEELEEKYMDAAIEAGALDIEIDTESSDDGLPRLKLWTEPTEASGVADAFAAATKLTIESSEMVWVPKKDLMVTVTDAKALEDIEAAVALVKEESSVQDVYLNME